MNLENLSIARVDSEHAILPKNVRAILDSAQKIAVIQAENPDGDSLGSALALGEIFANQGKKVSLHCPVQIPIYLRFMRGWDLVEQDFDYGAEAAIIVDTSAKTLMSQTLDDPAAANWLAHHPVVVLDHHVGVTPDLPFDCEYVISDTAVATGELIFDLATQNGWEINAEAATDLYASIQADSLGLTTEATTAASFFASGKLVELGAKPADVDNARRELMKKKPEILAYKGELISRIEYLNGGRTALVHVPFEEIQKYSNDYNPTMLVMDDMRLVVGVDVAIGVKTYPDGKLTGKLRSNLPVSNLVAKNFGGDGHPYAAGFRVYEGYDEFLREFVPAMEKIYAEFDAKS